MIISLIFIIVLLFIADIILLVALRLQKNENERLKEKIKILNHFLSETNNLYYGLLIETKRDNELLRNEL